MKSTVFFIAIFSIFVGLDIVSKYYVLHDLSAQILSYPRESGIPIFHFLGIDFFIGLTFNKGAAWGMFSNFNTILLIARMAIVILLLGYMLRAHAPKFPLLLIVSGAVGNILDFFVYGYVIDFLHFKFWGHSFPLFNFADSLITIGVLLLFLNLYSKKKDARV